MIECQTCGWIGEMMELEAPLSEIEPGCPSCGSTNFLDIENELPEDDWRERR